MTILAKVGDEAMRGTPSGYRHPGAVAVTWPRQDRLPVMLSMAW